MPHTPVITDQTLAEMEAARLRRGVPTDAKFDPRVGGFVRDIRRTADERVNQNLDEPSVSDRLAAARAFLSRPNILQPNVQDVAETDRRIAEGVQRRREFEARPGATRPFSLEDITRGLAETGTGVQTSTLAALTPARVAPSLAPILRKIVTPALAAGEVLQFPENLRRGIEDPSQGMGLGEGATRIGALLFGAGLGRRGGPSTPTPEEMAGGRIPRPFGPSPRRPTTQTETTTTTRPAGEDPFDLTPLGRAARTEETVQTTTGPFINPNQIGREIPFQAPSRLPPTAAEFEHNVRGGRQAVERFNQREAGRDRIGVSQAALEGLERRAARLRPDVDIDLTDELNALSRPAGQITGAPGLTPRAESGRSIFPPEVVERLRNLTPAQIRRLGGETEPTIQALTPSSARAMPPTRRPHRRSTTTFTGPRERRPRKKR
jgi:hypothetical protein